VQADRRQAVTASGREGADLPTRVDLLTDGHRSRHRLVGGPQLPVTDRYHAAPGEQARIGDEAGPGGSNRRTGRSGEVDAAMAGGPSLQGWVEPADDGRGLRYGKHPARGRSLVGDGGLRQEDAHRDEHGDDPAAGRPGAVRNRPDSGPFRALGWRGHGAIVAPPAGRSRGLRGGLWTTRSDLDGLCAALRSSAARAGTRRPPCRRDDA